MDLLFHVLSFSGLNNPRFEFSSKHSFGVSFVE